MNTLDTTIRAAQLGFATGIRSMTPLAVVSAAATTNPSFVSRQWLLCLLRRREVAVIAALAAGAEIVADKVLPLPPRINVGPLLGRIGIGALLGAAVCVDEQDSSVQSALMGGFAAVAGAFGSYAMRDYLPGLPVSSLAIACLEDLAAFTLSWTALSRRTGTLA